VGDQEKFSWDLAPTTGFGPSLRFPRNWHLVNVESPSAAFEMGKSKRIWGAQEPPRGEPVIVSPEMEPGRPRGERR
jgi:hypothetical protein